MQNNNFCYNSKDKTKGLKIKNIDKKTDKTIKKEEKKELLKPSDIKKIIEKNRFGGYYKTKIRFIN